MIRLIVRAEKAAVYMLAVYSFLAWERFGVGLDIILSVLVGR